jgi:hypothetical protein
VPRGGERLAQGGRALRILLDENVPVQRRNVFGGHEVTSVNDRSLGWKNINNGPLLAEMEGRFDPLVTAAGQYVLLEKSGTLRAWPIRPAGDDNGGIGG